MAEDPQRLFIVGIFGSGGSRCLLQPLVLNTIEKRLKRHSSAILDMTVGVSGGIITQAIQNLSDPTDPSKPRYWAEDSIGLFDEFTPVFFPKTGLLAEFNMYRGKGRYNSENPKKVLDQLMGDTRLSECRTNSMCLVTTTNRRKKATWPSYVKGMPDRSKAAWSTARLKDLIIGGTQIPIVNKGEVIETYPEGRDPLKHRIVDGYGFLGSLPEKVYMDAQEIAPPGAKIIILYFGTGMFYPLYDQDVGLSRKTLDMMAHTAANAALYEGLRLLKKKIGDACIILDAEIDQQKRPNDPFDNPDNGTKDQNQRLKGFAPVIIEENAADLERFYEMVERRDFIEDKYQRSKAPFGQLINMIDEAKTPHDIAQLNASLVNYVLNRDRLPDQGQREQEIWDHCRGLTTQEHRENILRLAQARLDRLREENPVKEAGKEIIHRMADAAREVGQGIADVAKGVGTATREALIDPFRKEVRTDEPAQKKISLVKDVTFSREDMPGYTGNPGALPLLSVSFNKDGDGDAPAARPPANINAAGGTKPPSLPPPSIKKAG